jgi:hypothetical protein
MTEKTEIEIWVAIAANGDYEVHNTDADSAFEALNENYGIDGPVRVVHLKLKVTLPIMQEITGDISDDAGETMELAAE